MEIDTSNRKEKNSDGAKDKRITAIDDDLKKPTQNKIPRKDYMLDKQMAQIEEVESDREYEVESDREYEVESDSDSDSEISKMTIRCSDGIISIDADSFCMESRLAQHLYNHGCYNKAVDNNSEIIKKVVDFCERRSLLIRTFSQDVVQLDLELNEFNSGFLNSNKDFALDLIKAAFELGIISLIDLMMEDVNSHFTKMSTDEAYKILPVNLKYHPSKLHVMEQNLKDCWWAIEEINDFNPAELLQLLKVSIVNYKILPYDQQRLWLIAHFLLGRRCNAQYYQEIDEEERRLYREAIAMEVWDLY